MASYLQGMLPRKKKIPPIGSAVEKVKRKNGVRFVPISSKKTEPVKWPAPQGKPPKTSPKITPEQRQRRQARRQNRREIRQDQRQAGRLAKLEYAPQQRAIGRQNRQLLEDLRYNLGLVNIDQTRDENTQNTYAEKGDQRLAAIQELLQKQLQGGVDRTAALYGDAQNQIGQNNQAALSAIEGATGEARSQMERDAERLGLTEALSDPLAKLSAELQGTKANFTANGTSALNNLISRGTDVNALGIKGQMDQAQRGAGTRADLVRSVQAALADIGSQYGTQRGDLRHETFGERNENRGALKDLAQMRGIATSAAFKQLQEARTERERQAALDKLAEEISRRTMNLQESQFGHNVEMDKENLGLAKDQFGFEKDRWQSEFDFAKATQRFNQALAMDDNKRAKELHDLNVKQIKKELENKGLSPIEKEMLRLQLRKSEAEIAKLNAQTRGENAKTGKTKAETSAILAKDADPKKFKGREGLNAYYDEYKVPPKVQQMVEEDLTSAAELGSTWSEAQRVAQKRIAAEGWAANSPQAKQYLVMMSIMYGKNQ